MKDRLCCGLDCLP